MGYSIGFIRGFLGLLALAALVALAIALVSELLGVGWAREGYPELGSGAPLSFGGFAARAGGAFAVSTLLSLLLERLEGGPLDPG